MKELNSAMLTAGKELWCFYCIVLYPYCIEKYLVILRNGCGVNIEYFVIPLNSETSCSCQVTLSLPYRNTIPDDQIGLASKLRRIFLRQPPQHYQLELILHSIRHGADLGFVGRGNIRFIVDVQNRTSRKMRPMFARMQPIHLFSDRKTDSMCHICVLSLYY